jgi:hypothetical protein
MLDVFLLLYITEMEKTHLVKSNPPSSSFPSGLGGSSTCARLLLGRVGLGTGDLLRGGLLLGGRSPPDALDGLRSNGAWTGFSGVLPMSAYFQNGAGELVGMCWLGRCAVLGGASLGCTRCGAGVTNDAPSSCRYDDVSVGDPGAFSTRPSVLDVLGFRMRGRGLSSVPAPVSSGNGFRIGRTGVECESRSDERGWGDPDGDTFRLRAERGSLAAISLGPEVM